MSSGALILLEPGNRILEETVGAQINRAADSKAGIDVRLCDFDDVNYHVKTEGDDNSTLSLSMGLPCYNFIDEKGGKNALETFYGKYKQDAETGFDITLKIPLADTGDEKAKEKLIKDLSLIKSNITGGVFDHFFTALCEGKEVEKPFKFDLRHDTTVFFCPRDDRVTIVFSLDFNERVDKEIAKIFLQEFVDTRKKIGRAPPTAYSANPPNELRDDFGISENTKGTLGYISFAVLKSHLDKGKKEVVVGVLQSFRTFLQYHIKCSKSHFHARMRKRVTELLRVLNRAKEEEKKEKKTAGGKTFRRN